MLFCSFTLGWCQAASPLKITVPILATDSHNHPVSGLTPESFVISEHKKPIGDISLVRATDLPLRLGVLIDTSRSERDTSLPEALQAVKNFASSTVRSGDGRAFILTFAEETEATAWLRKEDLPSVAINVSYGPATVLYDSIAIACQQRMSAADSDRAGRRVLVVISDGDDNKSHITIGTAESEALMSRTTIFTIVTHASPVQRARGDRVMAELATATGGQSFTGLYRDDMPKVFATLGELIGGMYYASYTPPIGGTVHEVEIRPAAKQKFLISYPEKYAWLRGN